MTLGRKNIILLVTTLAFFSEGLALLSYSPIERLVSSDFHLSYTESGIVTSAFGVMYALMQIPGGYFADRSRGKSLLSALFVLALSPLVFIGGNGFLAAFVSRAIGGAAMGVAVPSSVRLISSWFSEKELDKAMGTMGSGFGVAQLLSYVVLPLFILQGDWRPPLLLTVALFFVFAVLAIAPTRWPPANPRQIGKASFGLGGLFTRNFIGLTLTNFANLAVFVGVSTWAPTFIILTMHLSQVAAGEVVVPIGVMGIVASYMGGIAARRLGNRRIIAIAVLLIVVSPILLGISNTLATAALAAGFLGMGGMLGFGATFAMIPYATKYGPEAAGKAFGVFNTFSNMGTFLSPVLLGFVVDSTGSFALALISEGLLALVGVLGVALLRSQRDSESVAAR